jgi:hypothetical protein
MYVIFKFFGIKPLAYNVQGLALAGHLSTSAEVKSTAKYSEKDQLFPSALLAPNRCYSQYIYLSFNISSI